MVSPLAMMPSAPGQSGSLLTNLIPFVLMFAIFYFLLIAPQRKKANAQAELVEHTVTGFVCRWQWQYAGAVIELLRNEELRTTFGRRSYEKAREQFDASMLTKKLEQLYLDLMDTCP